MKKLIIILFLIPICLNAQMQMAEDYSFKSDKKLHTIAGFAISTSVFYTVNYKTNNINLASRAAIFSAFIIAGGKEFGDIVKGEEASIADFTYTGVSAIFTTLILKGITKHRNKKKAKRERLFQMALNDI